MMEEGEISTLGTDHILSSHWKRRGYDQAALHASGQMQDCCDLAFVRLQMALMNGSDN